MTDEAVSALWDTFFTKHSMAARNELLMHYLPVVKYVVGRVMPTYRKYVEQDDLVSSGVLGLLDAIDKFKPDKGVKFETYASVRVRGAVIDHLRAQDWAPSSLRHKLKRLEEAFSVLEERNGRTATEAEVAEHLAMRPEEVSRLLDEAHTFNLIYMEDALTEQGDFAVASTEGLPEPSLLESETLARLASAIDSLPERERQVITLYYHDELTLKEIGLVLGVSESRVSQIHSRILMALRGKMA
jgi:RNA polymerase sigma factor for flagellar operon FliA